MALDSSRPVDVLVLGNTTADRVMVVDGPWRAGMKAVAAASTDVPGGEGANVAVTLAGLGVRVHYLGRFGDDDAGAASRDALARAGCLLDGCATVPGCPHHHAVVVVDRATGERSIVSHRDPRLDLTPDAVVPEWVERARALSIDGQEPRPSLAAAQLATRCGTTVFADAERGDAGLAELVPWVGELVVPLGVLRQLAGPAEGRDGGRAAAKAADLPTHDPADEAATPAGPAEHDRTWDSPAPEYLLRAMAARGPSVVVATAGPAGCHALADGQTLSVPAEPVAPVDTTGAGDAFHAGYIAARLAGAPLDPALRFATRVAARKCATAGPRLRPDQLADLRAELAQAGAPAADSSS